MLNTTQNTCSIVQHNSAVNYCSNLQQNTAQQIAAALKANKIAVRKATAAYYNNTACIVLRNAAAMQNALTIAKQVLAQNNIVCNKITVKKYTVHFYLQQNAINVKLFTTKASNAQSANMQQLQHLIFAALQQYLQQAFIAHNIVSAQQMLQAFVAIHNSNTLYLHLQSNTQQQATQALANLFMQHNISASVMQNNYLLRICLL